MVFIIHMFTELQAGFYHKFFSIFTICVMVWQAFMPYSHFITKVSLSAVLAVLLCELVLTLNIYTYLK